MNAPGAAPRLEQVSEDMKDLFKHWTVYLAAFWEAIKLDANNFGIPVPSVPVFRLEPGEPDVWHEVGSGEHGTAYEVRRNGERYLVKRILQRPSRRVNILGLLPPASEQLEAVREGAFIFAISAIGYSALLRKANAFFVDLTSTPYEVYIGMEYIEGWLLCSVLAPDSAGCLLLNERLRAVAELGFLLEYLSLYDISHNDLSLGNIMIRTQTRRIVLIDYGAVSVGQPSNDLNDYRFLVQQLLPRQHLPIVPHLLKASSFTQVGECLRNHLLCGPHFLNVSWYSQRLILPVPSRETSGITPPWLPAVYWDKVNVDKFVNDYLKLHAGSPP